MALVFCESFDGVETPAQLQGAVNDEAIGLRKWRRRALVGGTGSVALVAGRTDRALEQRHLRSTRYLGVDRARLFLGFALFIPTGSLGAPADGTILGVGQTGQDNDAVNNTGLLSILVSNTAANPRRLAWQRDSSTIALSASNVWQFDTWFYVEMEALASAAAGEVRLRVNGLQVLETTGVQTSPVAGGTHSWERISISTDSVGWAGVTRLDDLYVVDDIGSVANDFLGDQIVEMIRPNGVGDLSEWVNSDGNQANNWNYVNERNIDEARYVNSTVVGARDIYQFQDLAANFGGLAGVQVTGRATHLGDPMNMSILAREGGFEAESSDVALQNFFETPVRLFLDAPDGGQWTRAKVNAAQFGTRAKAP